MSFLASGFLPFSPFEQKSGESEWAGTEQGNKGRETTDREGEAWLGD